MTLRAHPYQDLQVIDSRAPRFNQVVVALTSLLALTTGFWPLVALLGTQLTVGLLFGRKYCLPCVFYFEFVQPRFGEGPLEDSRAPRFANILGAVFLVSAAILWSQGFVFAGQLLTAMVAALASLAVSTGLCVGCEMYKVISKLRGIKGGVLQFIDLEQLSVGSTENLVVFFTHPLCQECQEVEPRLTASGKSVFKIDVSKRKDLAQKYGIGLVPFAVSVASDGRVLARL
jgi:Domain of unknown function (DUF4395)